MRRTGRQNGISLTEMLVVAAILSLLAYFVVPASRTVVRSFESAGGVRTMISAALSSARAIAAKEHRYAGIRFQKASGPDPLKAPQYMIFIIHDKDKTDYANGFRAVEGLKPIKLPDSVGVMDLWAGGAQIVSDSDITDTYPASVIDTTTFSIIFSPSGKLVIHDVRVAGTGGSVFGTGGMFPEDGAYEGLTEEPSRNSFLIYDRRAFRQAYEQGRPWSGYLAGLVDEMIYINPYTGTLINR